MPTSQGELNAVFDAVDKKRSGKITYQQFVSAVHNDQSVRACLYNLYTHTHTHTHARARAFNGPFVWDHPGGPVPER